LQALEEIAVTSPAMNLLEPQGTSRLAEFGTSVTIVEHRPVIRRLTPPRKGDDLDGNGNAHGCEVVHLGARRDRPSGTTAASIAALNSTAGSAFGDPRGRSQRSGQASDGCNRAENGCIAMVPHSMFASRLRKRPAPTRTAGVRWPAKAPSFICVKVI
jgi:hypothetical protein